MYRPETKIEMEVKVLCNKPMHRINWRIILRNHFVPIASGVCGLMTEHLGLKPYRNP
jgi:hypothetical protein